MLSLSVAELLFVKRWLNKPVILNHVIQKQQWKLLQRKLHFLYLALQSIVKHFDFTEANEVIKFDRLQTFRIRHNHLNHVRFF